jgi:hypothetical protein
MCKRNPDRVTPGEVHNGIQIRDITSKLQQFTLQINSFLENLTSVKDYLNLEYDRIV